MPRSPKSWASAARASSRSCSVRAESLRSCSMSKRECGREFEVLECAATGAPGEELRAHIAACEPCRDLFDVARSVVDDRAVLMRDAHLPSAGLVWWRANMRAQREAAQAAGRSGQVIQLVLLGP